MPSCINLWAQPSNFISGAKVKKVPIFISYSPSKLAKYLTKNDTSNAQKAYNIYLWIAENIKYDVNELQNEVPKSYSVHQTLLRRKGVCFEYSKLYSILCQSVGIPTLEILGYCRGVNYYEDDSFYEENHSWNGIKLDSTWYFVDPTWGSGYLKQKKRWLSELGYQWFKIPYLNNKYKFQRKLNPDYFLVQPEKLISTHLSLDPSWQLLYFPVAHKTFASNSWDGYKNQFDSIAKLEMKPSDYEKKLNTYATLSPLQYLEATALKSNEFNPLNFKLLAISNFSLGASFQKSLGDKQQKLNDKMLAMKYYRNAITYARNHQRTTAAQSMKEIKKVNERIGNSLFKPITKRLTNTSKMYQWSNSITIQEEILKTKRKNELLTIQEQMKNIKYKELEKKNTKSTVSNETIEGTKDAITLELNFIDNLYDSSQLEEKKLKLLLDSKEKLQSIMLDVAKDIKKIVSKSTNSVINIELINTLEEVHSEVSIYGDTLDAYFNRYKALEKELGEKLNRCEKINNLINKKYAIIQKLIEQNCKASNGLKCDDNYSTYFDFIFNNMSKNYSIKEHYASIEDNDFEFFKKLNVTLYKQIDAMKRHLNFIQLYQKARIGFIQNEKTRSDYITQKVINESNSQLSKIPFEIDKLIQSNR